MIEQGLVQLVQSNSAVMALCKAGGYYAQLPETASLPSWSYIFVSNVQAYSLSGPERNWMRRLQIDVYGADGADTITLANAIAAVLSGYQGSFPDPDATVVQGCFQSDLTDFFDDTARSYRRMLEYEVYFQQ